MPFFLKKIEEKRDVDKIHWKLLVYIHDILWTLFAKILVYPISLLAYILLYVIGQKKLAEKESNVAAVILSYKRIWNIPLIALSLKRQSFIDEIMVIHNYPSRLKIPGCKNIFLDKNYGCIIRHKIAAKNINFDYFVFIDDDLILIRDIGKDILPYIRSYGDESVIGIFGRQLNFNDIEKAYSEGKEIISRDEVTPVDIVKGRFHIISQEGIKELEKYGYNTPALNSEDDIRANIILQKKFQKPSFTIPFFNIILDLDNSNSNENRNDHIYRRDKAICDALDSGWMPIKPEKDKNYVKFHD